MVGGVSAEVGDPLDIPRMCEPRPFPPSPPPPPVLDDARRVVGVLSRKDLVGALGASPVSAHMTAPPRVIRARAFAADAAAQLAMHRVHRLPVVDAEGRLVGVVSRSDLAPALPADLRRDLLAFARGDARLFRALELTLDEEIDSDPTD